MKKWKKLATTVLLDHPRMTIMEDDILLPNGHESKYIYYTDGDGAMAVCIRGDEILIQREYSYPPDAVMYELPGGGVGDDKDPIRAAVRELQEETGYTSESGQYLGWYYKDNRRTKTKMHVVLVENPTLAEKSGGDIEEVIEPEWVKLEDLRQMISEGKIVNSSILIGLALYGSWVGSTRP